MCMSLLNEGASLGHAGGAVDLSYCPLSFVNSIPARTLSEAATFSPSSARCFDDIEVATIKYPLVS